MICNKLFSDEEEGTWAAEMFKRFGDRVRKSISFSSNTNNTNNPFTSSVICCLWFQQEFAGLTSFLDFHASVLGIVWCFFHFFVIAWWWFCSKYGISRKFPLYILSSFVLCTLHRRMRRGRGSIEEFGRIWLDSQREDFNLVFNVAYMFSLIILHCALLTIWHMVC